EPTGIGLGSPGHHPSAFVIGHLGLGILSSFVIRHSSLRGRATMPTANPDKLKLAKEVSRKETAFTLARVPKTGRVFFGASDFKVYDVDLAQDKPEAKELGGHDSYVTGVALAGAAVVSGSYDGKLIW